MPIVMNKSVNLLLTKFTPKAGQIYPQGVNLPPVKNPWTREIVFCFRALDLSYGFRRLSVMTSAGSCSLCDR